MIIMIATLRAHILILIARARTYDNFFFSAAATLTHSQGGIFSFFYVTVGFAISFFFSSPAWRGMGKG